MKFKTHNLNLNIGLNLVSQDKNNDTTVTSLYDNFVEFEKMRRYIKSRIRKSGFKFNRFYYDRGQSWCNYYNEYGDKIQFTWGPYINDTAQNLITCKKDIDEMLKSFLLKVVGFSK